jgi:MYXO-CTERM domain-containing protein
MSIAAGSTTLQFSPAIGAGFVTETIADPAFTNITTLNVSLVAESTNLNGSDIYVVDNFQVRSDAAVVPTPSAAAAGLVGLGLAMVGRRRHRA